MTGSWFVFICVLWLFTSCLALYEGDVCSLQSGGKGKCVIITKCPYALSLIKNYKKPWTCGFQGKMPIVCCPSQINTTTDYQDTDVSTGPNAPAPRPIFVPVENPRPFPIELLNKPVAQKGAPVGQDNASAEQNGNSGSQKSIEKCNEYYPPPKDETGTILVHGGNKTLAKEFPHMAAIGYGKPNDIQWLCGGSLISRNFVLTAAHCAVSREFGAAKTVRLGDLDIKNTTDDAKPEDFTISQTFIHPDYSPPSHYHDIALFRLDRDVQFNDYIKPACLHAYHPELDAFRFLATGWGTTDFLGEPSSHLMKVFLDRIDFEACRKQYSNQSPARLPNGIRDDIQVCAGDYEGRDTCPGDSGGPLQYKSHSPNTYRIAGITSFGKACGVANTAGVYTRVSYYLSWIESIVWPE